jgi:vacuolar protein sorting-associated protein 72
VDSDFSIDENDEPISDEDNEEEGRRRRSRKSVYREPKRETNNSITNINRKFIETKRQLTAAKPQTAGSSGQRVRRNELKSKVLNKKSFRESTRRNARETELRVKIAKKESEARKKSSRRWDNECRQLTQSEMLREAKKTEALNLKSLERYQKLELEKSKKNKVVKEVAKGPFVRYQSVAMPLVEEINEESNVNENEVNF